ncbi:MAG: TadE family protein [Pseudomonadota bacterium]
MVSGLIKSWVIRLRGFLTDSQGSVSVDFIVSIPILLAVLVLTSEYGRVLQARSTLDNAVADATRYLSRVPANEADGSFSPKVVAIAEQLITSRINTRYIAIGSPVLTTNGDFTTVSLAASVGVISPALSVLNVGSPFVQAADGSALKDVEGLVITSSDTVRHFGR